MTERMTVALEDGTRALLVELAGGERKIGAYLSVLVRDVHSGRLVDGARLAKQEQYVSDLESIIPDTINKMAERIDNLEKQVKETLRQAQEEGITHQ